MRNNETIYSINFDDVQTVAEQELDRKLTIDEPKIVADKIGDEFDWHSTIAAVLDEYIAKSARSTGED